MTLRAYERQYLQERLEENYYKEPVEKRVLCFIKDSYQEQIVEGTNILYKWLDYVEIECKSPKKIDRLSFLRDWDLEEVVQKAFLLIAFNQEALFTTVSAQLSSKMKFSDTADAIQTAAEILAVLAHTKVFTVYKRDKQDSLRVHSYMQFPEDIQKGIENTMFNLPMVCPPKELQQNTDSPYLTVKDKLILGKKNFHSENISLDVLNTQNSIPLSLNLEFLKTVKEVPTKDFQTLEQEQQWKEFIDQSNAVYLKVLRSFENVFYLPNSVDKRGRMYARGYHITTQGTSFKKSMIDFAETEVVTGIPENKHERKARKHLL